MIHRLFSMLVALVAVSIAGAFIGDYNGWQWLTVAVPIAFIANLGYALMLKDRDIASSFSIKW